MDTPTHGTVALPMTRLMAVLKAWMQAQRRGAPRSELLRAERELREAVPLTESALIYARLCELATQLHKPEAMSELRRLGAIHRQEYNCLPSWVKEAAGLKDAGINPAEQGQ